MNPRRPGQVAARRHWCARYDPDARRGLRGSHLPLPVQGFSLSEASWFVRLRRRFARDVRYGEIIAGVYNGEGYARGSQQPGAMQIGTLRPFQSGNPPRGSATFFYTGDHAVGRGGAPDNQPDHPPSTALSMGWSYLDAATTTCRTARGGARLLLDDAAARSSCRRRRRRMVPSLGGCSATIGSSPTAVNRATSSAGSPASRTGPRCEAPVTAPHSCSTTNASTMRTSRRHGRTNGVWLRI